MLSLDPEGDPYRMCFFLDQLALRGGQSEHLLELSRNPFYAEGLWQSRPNINVSSALAEVKLKQAQKCRASLQTCVEDYPWIFPRLFQELNIDHIPRSVWGKTPSTDREKFECELYVHNAKDLWNTPEAISFLVEVVESVEVAPMREKARTDLTPLSNEPITLDEARHVILSGVPSLINLIPREYTTMPTSSSDPLPPPDNLPSYDPAPASHLQGPAYQSPFEAADDSDTPPAEEERTPNPRAPQGSQRGAGEAQEPQGVQGFLRRVFPFLGPGSAPERIGTDTGTDALRARAAELNAELDRPWFEPLQEHDAPETESSNTVRPTVGPDPESDQHSHHGSEDIPQESPNPDPGPGPEPTTEEPYDDDRNQRWLAGQGMLRLRDFCARHGTDENAWNGDGGVDSGIVAEYAARAMQLRQPRTRNFILDYPLTQGTSRDVRALVEREMGRRG